MVLLILLCVVADMAIWIPNSKAMMGRIRKPTF